MIQLGGRGSTITEIVVGSKLHVLVVSLAALNLHRVLLVWDINCCFEVYLLIGNIGNSCISLIGTAISYIDETRRIQSDQNTEPSVTTLHSRTHHKQSISSIHSWLHRKGKINRASVRLRKLEAISTTDRHHSADGSNTEIIFASETRVALRLSRGCGGADDARREIIFATGLEIDHASSATSGVASWEIGTATSAALTATCSAASRLIDQTGVAVRVSNWSDSASSSFSTRW